MPQCHKVHNWREYNASLQKRGDIFFFHKEKDTAKLPGNTQYDDACIMMTHHIKYTFKLGYRQTQGVMEALKRQGLINQSAGLHNLVQKVEKPEALNQRLLHQKPS